MYSFMFNVKLPSTMSIEEAAVFFNEFNAKVNSLVLDTQERYGEAMNTSTYVIDDTDGRPVV